MTCRWTSALPEDEACRCSAGNIDSARIAATAHTATPILMGWVFNKDCQYTGRVGPEVKVLRDTVNCCRNCDQPEHSEEL